MSLQGKRRKGGGRAGRRQEGVEGGPERRDRAKGEGGEDTKGVGPVSQGIGSPFSLFLIAAMTYFLCITEFVDYLSGLMAFLIYSCK